MPTLNVSLTEELADYIEREVCGGDYMSASEVVRDALRVMRHEKDLDAAKLEILRSEVGKGIEQAERGEFSLRTVRQIMQAVLDEETE
jgi:antitoxin ParD1/3/4